MPRRHTNRNLRLSSLEEDVLTLLVGRDLCTQDIIELLAQASDGYAKIVQSTPYSVLPHMEEKRYVDSRWSRVAKPRPVSLHQRYYHLTAEGLRVLQERRSFRARLDALSTSLELLICRNALNRCLSLL